MTPKSINQILTDVINCMGHCILPGTIYTDMYPDFGNMNIGIECWKGALKFILKYNTTTLCDKTCIPTTCRYPHNKILINIDNPLTGFRHCLQFVQQKCTVNSSYYCFDSLYVLTLILTYLVMSICLLDKLKLLKKKIRETDRTALCTPSCLSFVNARGCFMGHLASTQLHYEAPKCPLVQSYIINLKNSVSCDAPPDTKCP